MCKPKLRTTRLPVAMSLSAVFGLFTLLIALLIPVNNARAATCTTGLGGALGVDNLGPVHIGDTITVTTIEVDNVTTSAKATTRAPVYSGKKGAIQLPRPPQPINPTSTLEFACDPNAVAGFRIRRPLAAVFRKLRRGLSFSGILTSLLARIRAATVRERSFRPAVASLRW